MSRFGYSEDEDWPGQFELWRSNTERALRGRKGQGALRELEAALVALPEKRLVRHALVEDGAACAVGELIIARRQAAGKARAAVLAELTEQYAPGCDRSNCYHARGAHQEYGCTECGDLARQWDTRKEQGELADWQLALRPPLCARFVEPPDYPKPDWEDTDTPEEAKAEGIPYMVAWRLVELNDIYLVDATDEARYEAVLRWVRKRLQPTAEAPA